MGLLSWILPDPTRRWPSPGTGAVTLDLRDGTVAGVRFFAQWQTLERLGRPANRGAMRAGFFVYPLRGFEIDAGDGRVSAFGLVFREALTPVDRHPAFVPCRVRVVMPDGREAEWTRDTTIADVHHLLGAPREVTGPDDDPTDPLWVQTLWYPLATCLVTLEFDDAGRFITVNVDPPAP